MHCDYVARQNLAVLLEFTLDQIRRHSLLLGLGKIRLQQLTSCTLDGSTWGNIVTSHLRCR